MLVIGYSGIKNALGRVDNLGESMGAIRIAVSATALQS